MADAEANDLTLAALNLDEDVGPLLTLESLELGEDAELLVRIVNLLSGPQAARLMCVNRLLKRAVMASEWPPWSPEPHILADGTVCEPLSGRYNAVIRPGDDWARVIQVIADAPEGATLLMMRGDYVATEKIELSRPIYIFGNGVIIRGSESLNVEAPIFSFKEVWGALVGLHLEANPAACGCMLGVLSGTFRVQGCTITAAQRGIAVYASRPASCPTIIDCIIRGGGVGCSFNRGACGTVLRCDVRGCHTGLAVYGDGNRSALRIEDSVFIARDGGVRIDDSVDSSFTLGTGNTIHGDRRDIIDEREGVPQPG